MVRLSLFAALIAGLAAGGAPAVAKAKKAKRKPRVLIFDPTDGKRRPLFDYAPVAPDKVSGASIFFTTVSSDKSSGSDEPADVTIEEKKLMLDEGKSEGGRKKAP